jgi:hypothetical protein
MEVTLQLFEIQTRGNGPQPAEIQRIDELQVFLFWTIQHHPDIQELLPVHPGHHTDNGILK